VHAVAFGRPLGFDDGQLASTAHGGAGDPGWSEEERLAYRLADELHARSDVSDDLFAELRVHFSAAQILELAVIAGWYHTISYVVNAARVELEPWAERLPAGNVPPRGRAREADAAGGREGQASG
jgi:alkylhydroperoxidase family enzyme